MITMIDTVIACVNTFVSNQPKLLSLTDRHGRLIGYVETPGVGANSYEVDVELSGVDTELEEGEMKNLDIEPEVNVEIP